METNLKAIELRDLWRRYKDERDEKARERLVLAYAPRDRRGARGDRVARVAAPHEGRAPPEVAPPGRSHRRSRLAAERSGCSAAVDIVRERSCGRRRAARQPWPTWPSARSRDWSSTGCSTPGWRPPRASSA